MRGIRPRFSNQDFRVTLKNPGSAVSALKGGNVKYLPILALTVAIFIMAGLAASLVPVLKAACIEPVEALRYE